MALFRIISKPGNLNFCNFSLHFPPIALPAHSPIIFLLQGASFAYDIPIQIPDAFLDFCSFRGAFYTAEAPSCCLLVRPFGGCHLERQYHPHALSLSRAFSHSRGILRTRRSHSNPPTSPLLLALSGGCCEGRFANKIHAFKTKAEGFNNKYLLYRAKARTFLEGFWGGNLSVFTKNPAVGRLRGQVWVMFYPEEYPLKGTRLGGTLEGFGGGN